MHYLFWISLFVVRWRRADAHDAVDFLSSFGYLDIPKGSGAAIIDHQTMEEAVRQFQRMYQIAVTGEVDEWTKYYMNQPRCGLPDYGKHSLRVRRSSSQYSWTVKQLTYKINSLPRELRRDDVRRVMRKAFDYWEQYVDLTFVETNDPDAIVQIEFGAKEHRPCPYPFRNGALAHAMGPTDLRVKEGGDMHFNTEFTWTDDENNKDHTKSALLRVAIHEAGHVIGLGHSNEKDSIMFPTALWDTKFRVTEWDRYNLSLMYDPPKKPSGKEEVGHKKTTPKTTQKPIIPTQGGVTVRLGEEDSILPNPCRSSADAITKYGATHLLFKDEWYWLVLNKTQTIYGPNPIKSLFPQITKPVDSAIEIGRHLYIFVGRTFYVYNGWKLLHHPQDISVLGFSQDITKVVLAYDYPFDREIYHFLWTNSSVEGVEYWKMNKKMERMEPTYPRPIRHMWGYVPENPDSAFTLNNELYFSKDKFVYKLNTSTLHEEMGHPIASGYPRALPSLWKACESYYVQERAKSTYRTPFIHIAVVVALLWL